MVVLRVSWDALSVLRAAAKAGHRYHATAVHICGSQKQLFFLCCCRLLLKYHQVYLEETPSLQQYVTRTHRSILVFLRFLYEYVHEDVFPQKI